MFCQAKDGIRDLVRSRGLGDVYKRQVIGREVGVPGLDAVIHDANHHAVAAPGVPDVGDPVSYTHLTLPTSDLV
mgnify:CR=1 FL=1